MFEPTGLAALNVDELPHIVVGPGCRRMDLPSRDGVRIWIVDMDPGGQWPHVDHHDGYGEDVFVVTGEIIEGKARHGPGTFLHFSADSSHRPRTDTGVRLFGVNLTDRRAELETAGMSG